MTKDPKAVDLDTYPPEYVFATSKAEVLAYLERLRAAIEQGPELTRFPEGAVGVVLHTVLTDESRRCPDLGDFGHLLQGCESVLRASFETLKATL
jgi:hypothetical protein